jgi:DNA-binding transcriptional regulator YiaG
MELTESNGEGNAIAGRVTMRMTLQWGEGVDPRTPSTEARESRQIAEPGGKSFILPSQMKEMRERLGYSQSQMGELFQVGEVNWIQWETGTQSPDPAASLLMRALYEGDVSTSYVSMKKSRLFTASAGAGSTFQTPREIR